MRLPPARLVILTAVLLLRGAVAPVDASDPVPSGWESQRSPITGLLTYLSGPERGDLPVPASEDPLAILRSHGALFGVTDPEAQLSLMSATACVLGEHHHRYQQVHRGIPVFTGQLIVHRHPDGTFSAVNGDFYPIHPDTPVDPLFTAEDALFLAGGRLGVIEDVRVLPSLVLVDPGWYGDPPQGVRLAWKMVVLDAEERGENVLVDAITGVVLDRWVAFPNVIDRQISDGSGQGGGNGPVVRSEGGAPTGDAILDAGYDFAGDTYRLLFDGYGRDSVDGAGMPLRVTGHWEHAICPNATWNGSRARFCDGLLTDDVVAHEFFHGVTGTSAGLIYQNQPGMLNESFSDVFGELVDLWNGDATVAGAIGGTPAWPMNPTGGGVDAPNDLRNSCGDASVRWRMGEETSFGAIRDMYFPACHNHPEKVNDALYPCVPGFDRGGVHIGSGIPNHAFAMLVDGKTYDGTTVNGIGAIRAGAIWFRALTVYLTPASFFFDAHPLFLQAGSDLLGSSIGDPRTGGVASETISASDLLELEAALLAVNFAALDPCGMNGPPPANDECVDRIAIGAGVTSYNTINATDSVAPYPDGSLCALNSLGGFYQDIWYTFTPPVDGDLTLSTCNMASFDTDLAIYTGDCGSLVPVACNGDTGGCGYYTSLISLFPVTGGVEYTIRVGSWGTMAAYTGDLSLDYIPSVDICDNGIDDDFDGIVDCADGDCVSDPACLWPGDDCIAPLPATLGANPFDTSGANISFEGVEAGACAGTSFGSFGGGDIWFSFTPGDNGILTVATCDAASFDTDLALFVGGCGTLSTLACNGDGAGCAGGSSVLEAVVFAGVEVRVRVGGSVAGQAGTGVLSLSLFTPPEDCTNGIDDDFDGSIDCVDPDCFGTPACVCEPFLGLVCEQGPGLSADLSWSNGEAYDTIVLRRDGGVLATLPGSATAYNDATVSAGQREYELIGQCGTLSTTIACAVILIEPVYFTMVPGSPTVEVPVQGGAASFAVGVTFSEDPSSPTFPSPTQGFSLGVAHDASLATATGVELVGSLAALDGGAGPQFANLGLPSGGFTIGVVYSFIGLETIALAAPEELLRVTYETVPASFDGFAAPVVASWNIASGLGSPPVETTMVVGGASLPVGEGPGTVTFNPLLGTPFLRGDPNHDGQVNIADAVFSLGYIFGTAATCIDAIDVNDSGSVDIADPIYLLGTLFNGGPPVAAPAIECGIDPTDDPLDCDSAPACD